MTNRAGAPKGNLNALKHGFYSRLFRSSESSDLSEQESVRLDNEIALLRVMMRRTMEMADGIDDLKEATRVLDALGAAASRLATLLRTQKDISPGHGGVPEELFEAIRQVNQELRNKK